MKPVFNNLSIFNFVHYFLDLSQNTRSERLSSNSIEEKIEIVPNSWIKLRCNASNVKLSPSSAASGSSSEVNSELQWFKDGQIIEQNMRRLKKWVASYDNSNYMELELIAVDSADSGNYQCKRDKTVLKNILLQVVDYNKGRYLFAQFVSLIVTFISNQCLF
jgi:hypothetical protein